MRLHHSLIVSGEATGCATGANGYLVANVKMTASPAMPRSSIIGSSRYNGLYR